MGEILESLPEQVVIAENVAQEAQYVLRGGTGEDAREREPVMLTALVDAGTLSIVASDDEAELQTFVNLTVHLDDGEAMTAALAIHRGGEVVTDDRKAERVLRAHAVPVRSTLHVIKWWADLVRLDLVAQRIVLLDLRQRGTYEPPRRHPLRSWWDTAMAASPGKQ